MKNRRNKNVIMEFNQLYWHDSVIKRIGIDRSNPGKNDIIEFEIDWYDTGLGRLVFEEVYWFRIEMNLGVVADESIDDAYQTDKDDADLVKFNNNFGKFLEEELSCYVIRTSSTGSEMKIIAKRFVCR